MFRQDFQKGYAMVSPSERLEIIQKINRGEMVSETATGIKENWWMQKHHPESEIPKNIYLLGQGTNKKGTIQELHIEYMNTYGIIEWSEFINYTRELIKQKIMI